MPGKEGSESDTGRDMKRHLAAGADSGNETEERERVGRRHGAVHVLVHELGAVEVLVAVSF